MATRRHCEGHTTSYGLRGASCFIRMVFGRWIWPDANDDHTKYTRRSHDVTRWPHDGHTNVAMDTRSQHDVDPSRDHRTFFWHAKDFSTTPEVAPDALEMLPKAIRWLKMATRIARWLHDQCRSWIFLQSCVHRGIPSGQCDASIMNILSNSTISMYCSHNFAVLLSADILSQ